jgi:hypothetical protein
VDDIDLCFAANRKRILGAWGLFQRPLGGGDISGVQYS